MEPKEEPNCSTAVSRVDAESFALRECKVLRGVLLCSDAHKFTPRVPQNAEVRWANMFGLQLLFLLLRSIFTEEVSCHSLLTPVFGRYGLSGIML